MDCALAPTNNETNSPVSTADSTIIVVDRDISTIHVSEIMKAPTKDVKKLLTETKEARRRRTMVVKPTPSPEALPSPTKLIFVVRL
jgi:hypothetical protein